MQYFAILTLLAVSSVWSSCQVPQPAASTADQSGAGVTTASAVGTEAEARAAVAQYLQGQPNAALYQPDSARIVDVNSHWQVLVPRSDWAQRMPNAAAFEVNKQTGQVTALRVK